MITRRRALQAALAACAAPGIASAEEPSVRAEPRPLIIAHRGASDYRPEHTEASYRLAIAQGADYIEPDLVLTRDGVFVARHENELSDSTDVAGRPEFAARKTTKVIEGQSFTGWFVEDFTFEELRTLRARTRRPDRPGSNAFDGQLLIPTLDEVIAIAKAGGAERGRPVGVCPELKNPNYHRSIGQPMEQKLADALAAAGWSTRDAPVIVQCFWPGPLATLGRISPVRRLFLVDSAPPSPDVLAANGLASWADVYSPAGLARIAGFAEIVGPELSLVLPRDSAGRTAAPTSLVADAHAAGLEVVGWSLTAENADLPADYRAGETGLGDLTGYAKRLFDLGIDGVFTDQPDLVVKARG